MIIGPENTIHDQYIGSLICSPDHVLHSREQKYHAAFRQFFLTFPYLLLAQIPNKELHLLILKGLFDIKDIHTVASCQQLRHKVASQKTTPTYHGTQLGHTISIRTKNKTELLAKHLTDRACSCRHVCCFLVGNWQLGKMRL